MLARALAFDDRTAAEVMTPRTRVTFLPAAAPVAEVVTATRESGHSRFPVVGQSMDDVVGIVHVKHAVAVPPEQRSKRKIRDVMAEPLLVPATLPLDTLLDRLRSRGLQLAVVVDEYGGTDGVVTFEDLIEELVGEVLDEHDESAVAAVVPRDGGWSVSGLLRPDEVSEATQIRLEAGEHETIAGMVLERLGHLPVVGEEVVIDQTRLVVESLDGRRIDRLTLFQIGNEQVDPGSSADSGRQQ
jgi:CBS domain containing-hemolysin-like protein